MALRLLCLLLFCCQIGHSQELKLLFIGDVMGHSAQYISAYDSVSQTFEFDEVFKGVKPIISEADFALANLEVTLAGKPYSSYPRFSSPDELAVALKTAGVDALMLANNHSADKGALGIVRTIDVVDSIGLAQTGTFKNPSDRQQRNVLVMKKNDISIGVLNYTYGLNGMPVDIPLVVNVLDTTQIKADLAAAQLMNLDKIIAFVHWGKEYQHEPSKKQRNLADFFFENGADIIIGSHPHVLQPMEYYDDEKGERFIAYSLGNFVSNQRTFPRDGGAMVELTLAKANGKTRIKESGYYLTWVDKTFPTPKGKFQIYSCAEKEEIQFAGMNDFSRNKMKVYMDSSRMLLQEKNIRVKEINR